MENLKISKSTIIRSILFGIVIINMILKSCGKSIIDVDETQISEFVEMLIQVLILIVGFWKNNSYSKSAISADEYLKSLK